VAAVLVVLLLLSFAPFVRARSDAPRRADAVVLLSGDHGERRPVALRLLRKGVAGTLVLVGTSDGAVEGGLCVDPQPFEVVCLRLHPDSTRLEARATAELAAKRGWRSVIVVTSTYHAARSQVLFRRCVHGSVRTVSAWPPYGRIEGAHQVVREWLATARAIAWPLAC